MTDDPGTILKAAGAECAEMEAFLRGRGPSEWEDDDELDAAFLALSRLVAKYKWQREIQVVGALDYNGAIARLDQLWEERQS